MLEPGRGALRGELVCVQEDRLAWCSLVQIPVIMTCTLEPDTPCFCFHARLAFSTQVLTITDFDSPPEVTRQREAIVLTARVHPGETCASWILQVGAQLPACCLIRFPCDTMALCAHACADTQVTWKCARLLS